jgi:hypothetical protein
MEVEGGWEELLSCSHGDPHGSQCLRERERSRLRTSAMEARVREIWGGVNLGWTENGGERVVLGG